MQADNPVGTDGFDFLEFTTQTPEILDKQFLAMGFYPVSKHKTRNITIYQQNDIRFIVNLCPESLAAQFAKTHGPSTSAMGFRVRDAKAAFKHAIEKGARACDNGAYPIPAIYGVGGSLIYFVDQKGSGTNYDHDFIPVSHGMAPKNMGLTYLDHVTHNLHRGNMDVWYEFYKNIFNFKEVRYFDIEGRLTGLKSRAMTSPCGKIRIPLNESSDDKSQIEEFLKDFNGEGIQHIALGTKDIYQSVEDLREHGLNFLDTPDTYYELIEKRLPNHGEHTERLQKNRILIDGTTQGERKLLLQIFTKNMLGPVFFEIIQRKGDEGFGEGNFRALFESIELDQIKRGVLTEEKEKP
ncbi:MAG: 4-hydroxyphenylpyruvate dioxygenase [Gammaproteobacteria bacterium]